MLAILTLLVTLLQFLLMPHATKSDLHAYTPKPLKLNTAEPNSPTLKYHS